MILKCPECGARYMVPDQSIGALGRTVRCAKCAHSWFQTASPEFAAKGLGELDKMMSDFNARAEAKPRPIPKGSNLPVVRREWMPPGIVVGMAVMAAVVIALGVLVYMPGLAGLPRSKGLALADIAISRRPSEGKPIYEINGKILNSASSSILVPMLRVTLIDTEGKLLQYWDLDGEGKTLDAGANTTFTTGELELMFSKASRFVVELGNPLELALRRKPQ